MRLTDADDLFRTVDYPIARDRLIDDHGHRVIEFQHGSETVADALSRVAWDRFDGRQEAVDALYTGVSNGAVGRRFYTDRDGHGLGVHGPAPVSF